MSAAASSNQSPPFDDVNLFSSDLALQEAVAAAGLQSEFPRLTAFGAQWGSPECFELGRLANENPPRFVPIDPRGKRIDSVEFHPAYHELMRRSMEAGLHVSTWEGSPHALRAAQLFMAYQAESGHICPITMTHAAMAAMRAEPALLARWRPLIAGKVYDPRARPWQDKSVVTLGMAMTERQGGADLRTNETRATRRGDCYEITGEKWFMSAPMSDAFLTLAQAQGGLTCFLLPRFTPEGALNGVRIQRLKDKLGDRSNASSEVAFEQAFAERVGPEGAGLRTILAMVQMTRLDCAIASAGLMRFGLANAAHHARHRRAFGRALIEQPAMRATLAELALEVEASTALALRLARAFDAAPDNDREAAYARLLTPAVKYLVCKLAPGFLYECMECLGGNGYVEDWPLARAYRQAPVNAIWEGSGNVMALDVLRAAARAPQAAAQVVADFQEPNATAGLSDELGEARSEGRARRTTERLARAAALAALRETQPALADAYRATRCASGPRSGWGATDLGATENVLIERILPA
ncbi:MAG TPA: acyl-CoA dehydrogenase family protein [Beijerinckiaceae bacterium]|nr:acyl-CoA dehydrogenase family protein [Beijerinckiaceae bacterium]